MLLAQHTGPKATVNVAVWGTKYHRMTVVFAGHWVTCALDSVALPCRRQVGRHAPGGAGGSRCVPQSMGAWRVQLVVDHDGSVGAVGAARPGSRPHLRAK